MVVLAVVALRVVLVRAQVVLVIRLRYLHHKAATAALRLVTDQTATVVVAAGLVQ